MVKKATARISFRLEKFEEAEIDFSEIEWMGQGFAHQLFVVFQNEHPQIRLIPTNMSWQTPTGPTRPGPVRMRTSVPASAARTAVLAAASPVIW